MFVVAAPVSADRPALTQMTVRLTCGDTAPRVTALSPWLPIGRPVERSSMLDVTQLRPFLSWARKRSLADGLALSTGIAPVTPALVCPTGQLALLDGDAVTSTVPSSSRGNCGSVPSRRTRTCPCGTARPAGLPCCAGS